MHGSVRLCRHSLELKTVVPRGLGCKLKPYFNLNISLRQADMETQSSLKKGRLSPFRVNSSLSVMKPR